jgi:hypothetical protein
MADVALDRLSREVELAADLLVGQPQSEKCQDVQLARTGGRTAPIPIQGRLGVDPLFAQGRHGAIVTVASVSPGVTPVMTGGVSGVLQRLGAVFGRIVNIGAPVAKYA